MNEISPEFERAQRTEKLKVQVPTFHVWLSVTLSVDDEVIKVQLMNGGSLPGMIPGHSTEIYTRIVISGVAPAITHLPC